MNASQINEVPTDEEDDDRQNQYDSESDDSEYEEDLFNWLVLMDLKAVHLHDPYAE